MLSRCPDVVCHPAPLHRRYKRNGSLTQSLETAAIADNGYRQILDRIENETHTMTPAIAEIAHAEFSANRALDRVFQAYLRQGRCTNLEEFLDRTDNGRADWLRSDFRAARAVLA